MTTATKVPNFTAEQEQMIRDASPLDLASATALGEKMGKGYRSIIAKAGRLDGVVYNRKPKATKSGDPIEHKDDIVAEISRIVEANLEGLEKAPKAALQAVRDYVTAIAA